jgi:hypothetical protein
MSRCDVLVAALLLLAACQPPRPPSPDTEAPTIETSGSLPALPDDVLRGVCLAHNWQDGGVDGYGTETSRETLAHLDELGVDAISVTPFGWMAGLDARRVRGEHTEAMPDGGETSRDLERVIEQAHALDMHVVLKPHLWIRGGEWRGEIEPTGPNGEAAWGAWWDSYRKFILYYARLAERHEVESFVAGVELVSAVEARPEQLRDTVDAIRSVYDGDVTYAANWHGSMPDELWSHFDSVGVQFYPPLVDGSDPTVGRLRAAIRGHLERWVERARRADRPLEILEVGYKSTPSAVSEPWGWPEDLSDSERVADESLQARAYRALFRELARLDRLRSLYLWKYFTDPTRDEGGAVGFSPRGKEAEGVLERAYRRR